MITTNLCARSSQDRDGNISIAIGTLGKMPPLPCDRLIGGSSKLNSHKQAE